MILSTALYGESQGRGEYEVKAAFVVNFAKFIEWPADAFVGADSPLMVCVAGKGPIEGGFDRAANGIRVGGHALRVERIDAPSTCHVLFVSASEARRFAQILQWGDERTVAIGEHARFLDAGGTINLLKDDNLVQFDINLKSVRGGRIHFSSKLLALSRNYADGKVRP